MFAILILRSTIFFTISVLSNSPPIALVLYAVQMSFLSSLILFFALFCEHVFQIDIYSQNYE